MTTRGSADSPGAAGAEDKGRSGSGADNRRPRSASTGRSRSRLLATAFAVGGLLAIGLLGFGVILVVLVLGGG